MKKYLLLCLIVLLGQMTQTLGSTDSGPLFEISESGSSLGTSVSITLCPNGTGPVSRQTYIVNHATLSIRINAEVSDTQTYTAGILVNTPGYTPNTSDCTPISNGYCLFTTSHSSPATVNVLSTGSFQVTPSGDNNEDLTPKTPQSVASGATQSFTVTANSGYVLSDSVGGTCPTGSFSGSTYTTGAITANCNVSFSAVPIMATVTTISSSQNPSLTSSPVTFTAHVSAGSGTPTGTVSFKIGGAYIITCRAQTLSAGVASCTVSSLTAPSDSIEATYTPDTSAFITSTSNDFTQSVVSDLSGITTVPAAPSDVIATPGNGQVTVSWLPPSNTGGQLITGYTVSYGITNSLNFRTLGCTTPSALSCTVTGLGNSSSYTFVVTASNGSGTGPTAYSSSVTPNAIMTVSPATLALSNLGGGKPRTITFTNVSGSDLAIDSTPSFSPDLPAGSSYSTSCAVGAVLHNGNACTVTVTPGTNATSSCTTGTAAPTPSVFSFTETGGSTSADAVVVGYGCQYQSGYLFNIDDTTPLNASIGGTVADLNDLLSSPLAWGAPDSIWGIDETSTISDPSPQSSSFSSGQLNCNGKSDGVCDTNNILIFYSAGASSISAGVACSQSTASTLKDWYLPSICEMGYTVGGSFPVCGTTPGYQSNIQYNLVNQGVDTGLSIGQAYWSSTESSALKGSSWSEIFATKVDSDQIMSFKTITENVRCVRALTP